MEKEFRRGRFPKNYKHKNFKPSKQHSNQAADIQISHNFASLSNDST